MPRHRPHGASAENPELPQGVPTPGIEILVWVARPVGVDGPQATPDFWLKPISPDFTAFSSGIRGGLDLGDGAALWAPENPPLWSHAGSPVPVVTGLGPGTRDELSAALPSHLARHRASPFIFELYVQLCPNQ